MLDFRPPLGAGGEGLMLWKICSYNVQVQIHIIDVFCAGRHIFFGTAILITKKDCHRQFCFVFGFAL